MSTGIRERGRLATKLAVAAALAMATVGGITHVAVHADYVCDTDTSSCIITPVVPAFGCKFGGGSANAGLLPPTFNWTGPTASCG